MANQPFYHLRPNKNIDRQLFLQSLIGLNQLYNISTYKYTGFGSYLFDDFKLLHETLNITNMVSLEKDKTEFLRAEFNVPYNCIEIVNSSSSEYLTELFIEDDSHNIFWLDYVSPDELGMQLADFASLINVLNPNDIVRITLNANPGSLEKSKDPDKVQSLRMEILKERVQERYLPLNLKPKHMTKKEYPKVLLEIIKAISLDILEDNQPYSPNFLMPLFTSVYADGQQMLTFTGIVLDSHDKESEIKEVLRNYPHNNFSWNQPCSIEIPALSAKEVGQLNKYLPNEDAQQNIIDKFPFIFNDKSGKAVESYINFYKYYPNYFQVSF